MIRNLYVSKIKSAFAYGESDIISDKKIINKEVNVCLK